MRRAIAAVAVSVILGAAGCRGGDRAQLQQLDASLTRWRDLLAPAASNLDYQRNEADGRIVEVKRTWPTDGTTTLVSLEKALPGAKLSYQAADRTLTAAGRGGGVEAAAAAGTAASALPGLDLTSIDITAGGDWTAHFRLAAPLPAPVDPLSIALPPQGLFEDGATKRLRVEIEKKRREVQELERLVGPDVVEAFAGRTRDEWAHARESMPKDPASLRNASRDIDALFGGPSPILHDGSLSFGTGSIRASGTTPLDAAALAARVNGRYEIEEVAGSKATLTRSTP